MAAGQRGSVQRPLRDAALELRRALVAHRLDRFNVLSLPSGAIRRQLLCYVPGHKPGGCRHFCQCAMCCAGSASCGGMDALFVPLRCAAWALRQLTTNPVAQTSARALYARGGEFGIRRPSATRSSPQRGSPRRIIIKTNRPQTHTQTRPEQDIKLLRRGSQGLGHVCLLRRRY